ncbi:hypothetical protein PR048_028070 [Dryococelus australis]|uniref:Uncharacterized protein n=1 Tax=Dryococelus australis TaxID=614101 RepID=A0ABQ9GIA7_9NEOP|nr:hypothetical protein PR048_028070 [Dryococelus australis]
MRARGLTGVEFAVKGLQTARRVFGPPGDGTQRRRRAVCRCEPARRGTTSEIDRTTRRQRAAAVEPARTVNVEGKSLPPYRMCWDAVRQSEPDMLHANRTIQSDARLTPEPREANNIPGAPTSKEPHPISLMQIVLFCEETIRRVLQEPPPCNLVPILQARSSPVVGRRWLLSAWMTHFLQGGGGRSGRRRGTSNSGAEEQRRMRQQEERRTSRGVWVGFMSMETLADLSFRESVFDAKATDNEDVNNDETTSLTMMPTEKGGGRRRRRCYQAMKFESTRNSCRLFHHVTSCVNHAWKSKFSLCAPCLLRAVKFAFLLFGSGESSSNKAWDVDGIEVSTSTWAGEGGFSSVDSADFKPNKNRGRCGVAVRLLASHLGEPGLIPGEVAPGFSQVGIVPFGGFSRETPASPTHAFRRCSILTSLDLHRPSRPRCYEPPNSLHSLTRIKPLNHKIARKSQRRSVFCSRRGRPRILARGNLAGRCRWSAGFPGDLSFLPLLHSDTAPYPARLTLIAFQDIYRAASPLYCWALCGGATLDAKPRRRRRWSGRPTLVNKRPGLAFRVFFGERARRGGGSLPTMKHHPAPLSPSLVYPSSHTPAR